MSALPGNAGPSIPALRTSPSQSALTVLDKPLDQQLLLENIELALQQADQRQRTHEQMADIRRRLAELTAEEEKILQMLMQGMPNKAMANRLQVSTRTIENRRRQLYVKMSAFSVPELVGMVVELNVRAEQQPFSISPAGTWSSSST